MALKNPHRSGSPVMICLVLLISMAFLAPFYHSHEHADDYHHESGDEHVLLHAGSAHEVLSTGLQHNGSHLHIKKDIGRTEMHLRFESSSLKADLYAVIDLSIFTDHLLCTLAEHTQSHIFRSSPCDCLSGLSPPAA